GRELPVGFPQGRTTRSSRWTTSWGTPSGSSEVWRPATPRSTPAGYLTSPFANGTPEPSTISTASSASNTPSTPWTPAGNSERFERGIDLDDLLDERGTGVDARIGGEQAAGVGQEYEHVRAHEVRHQGREAVVVAVADLVVGDGVVLVDHGDHPEVEEPAQG